jgi:hypothetical protein
VNLKDSEVEFVRASAVALSLRIKRCSQVCVPRKLEFGLCQNCVRYPLQPRVNTVIYGDTPMDIVVAGSR